MKRGEIWDVDLPPPRGGKGREQTGTRPAVIVSSGIEPDDPVIVVVVATSKLGALRFKHTLRVEPSTINGLTKPSVLLLFQVAAVDRDRFKKKRGDLEEATLKELDGILRNMLGL
jgi:mRNA interferase MazF